MKLRVMGSLCVGMLMFAGSTFNSHAWLKSGFVFCDANTDQIIDTGDVPVPGVLVVVVNTSGTFSNAAFTDVNGFFQIPLPNVPDTFTDFIEPSTLPVGTTAVIPVSGSFSTTQDMQDIANSFLIENPSCVPVPPVTGSCWMTGGGIIRTGKGQPIFSFGGNVNPGCSPTAGEGGNWNVIWHTAGLHFQGTSIQVIDCGNLEGFPPGSTSPVSPFNFIDFQGTGTIKGVGGNKTPSTPVFFVARAVDLGEPGGGIDMLYLRVFDASGTTLLLISSTPASPTTVSPLLISSGNIQIHPCKKAPQVTVQPATAKPSGHKVIVRPKVGKH